MPVKYFGVPKRDPRNLAAPVKYYPATRCHVRKELRDLAQYIVDLGEFGSFRLVLRGSMAAAGEKIPARDIVKGRVVFKPGKHFQRVLNTLDFEKSTPPRKRSIPGKPPSR